MNRIVKTPLILAALAGAIAAPQIAFADMPGDGDGDGDGDAPPMVEITAPEDGATFDEPQSIEVSIQTENDVTMVTVIVDGADGEQKAPAPCTAGSFDYCVAFDVPLEAGTHMLEARAVDGSLQSTTSAAVEVVVFDGGEGDGADAGGGEENNGSDGSDGGGCSVSDAAPPAGILALLGLVGFGLRSRRRSSKASSSSPW